MYEKSPTATHLRAPIPEAIHGVSQSQFSATPPAVSGGAISSACCHSEGTLDPAHLAGDQVLARPPSVARTPPRSPPDDGDPGPLRPRRPSPTGAPSPGQPPSRTRTAPSNVGLLGVLSPARHDTPGGVRRRGDCEDRGGHGRRARLRYFVRWPDVVTASSLSPSCPYARLRTAWRCSPRPQRPEGMS
jgi:hypothetical protein